MASDRPTAITSWSDLQREVESIVERLNDDQELALGAAANPLLALEEMGYEIAPSARTEIEERLRFRPEDAKKLRKLRQDVVKEIGRPFDLTSDDEVRQALSDVGVKAGRGEKAGDKDPFEKLRDKHAAVAPLLAYRAMESSEPRLARSDVYADVRHGKRPVPVTRLRLRLKSGRER